MINRLRKPDSRKFLILIFIGILVISVDLFFTLAVHQNALRVAALDIIPVIANSTASAALFWASKRSYKVTRQLGRAWLVLAVAQSLYTLGDISWAVIEIGWQINPYPSIADLFYLLYYPTFMVGVIMLAVENRVVIDRIKNTLDMAIIMGGVILVIWYFLFHPLLQANIGNPWTLKFLALAYPLGDIALLGSILWLLNCNPQRISKPPIFLLIISSTLTIVVDVIYSFQSSLGTYKSGGILDIGWVVSYLLVALAGFHQASLAPRLIGKEQPTLTIFDPIPITRRILSYLPYAWLVFAYALLFLRKNQHPAPDYPILYFWVGAIICLVIIRQLVALAENKKLYTNLYHALNQMKQQAATLETTNRELESEINQRVMIEQRLTYDALHDGLTDLPNRVFFMRKLKEAIDITKAVSDRTYSVLYMDIDQFKVINDSLGHKMGDELLKILAQRLKNCLRSTDSVARLGGDEFVFLIENVPSENAVDFIIHRIRTELASVIILDNHPIFITTSIGVVWNLRGYESPDHILRDADLAMYHAKRMGKDRFEVFHEGLRLQAISRLEIEENLRSAIKNHELMLYYQPILDLQTNRVVGFEALMRWDHPHYGVIYPAEFLPIAEETGLDMPLGRWSLNEACIQTKDWFDKCPGLKKCYFSVNVSGRQFTQENFINTIKRILHETKADPTALRLEITENTLVDYNEEVKEKFSQLRDMGISLSIDDFGTGYSSLSYLQNFPAGSFKIDRSFIREIGIKKSAVDLIRSMISLGQDLELEVIAEGIESPHQLEELKKLNCRYGQGFLLSLPLTAGEMESYLKELALGLNE